jgi:hypothetical protein
LKREAKEREEYLEMQERRELVQVGHRLSDQTNSTESSKRGQKSTKFSSRPGIEYLLFKLTVIGL